VTLVPSRLGLASFGLRRLGRFLFLIARACKRLTASWFFELLFGFLALSLWEISQWTKTAFSNWSLNTTAEFVFSISLVSTQFSFVSVALYVLFCMAITAVLVFYGVIFTIVNRIHEPK
jgi:hypothetical protein